MPTSYLVYAALPLRLLSQLILCYVKMTIKTDHHSSVRFWFDELSKHRRILVEVLACVKMETTCLWAGFCLTSAMLKDP